MTDQTPITAGAIASLAAVADLAISRDRQAALVPPMSVLVAAANVLSARMAEADRGIVPMLRFPGR